MVVRHHRHLRRTVVFMRVQTCDGHRRSLVTNATIAGENALYGYDEIGNSTDWAANGLNQYAQFSYDPDGNLLSDGVRTFAA